jgi:hypothetical protein
VVPLCQSLRFNVKVAGTLRQRRTISSGALPQCVDRRVRHQSHTLRHGAVFRGLMNSASLDGCEGMQ